MDREKLKKYSLEQLKDQVRRRGGKPDGLGRKKDVYIDMLLSAEAALLLSKELPKERIPEPAAFLPAPCLPVLVPTEVKEPDAKRAKVDEPSPTEQHEAKRLKTDDAASTTVAQDANRSKIDSTPSAEVPQTAER
eukprot:TRINITY_DN14379_c0_g1_i1.p1 TRINITY_DN14379_c0_g1~~TRINITY_DN14379_c0_g1_i1.p1  ORF type:complete len:135 (+),score=14.13 TRINITY_DN14379_c0_g1_i1:158-562(+)